MPSSSSTPSPRDVCREPGYLIDNIPEEEKIRRLNEMIELQTQLSLESNLRDVGKTFEVLIEGFSKRSREQLFGRSQQNKVVVSISKATASVSMWMYASSPPRQRPSSGSPCALPKAIRPKPSKRTSAPSPKQRIKHRPHRFRRICGGDVALLP